ncbi:hypothetical protein B0H14DRAFT_3865582 [Mycena olivaceomarginata]|nr:hypothetical protein B0H14DRAFT_3865582 [Mycena olivaceomarginata]
MSLWDSSAYSSGSNSSGRHSRTHSKAGSHNLPSSLTSPLPSLRKPGTHTPCTRDYYDGSSTHRRRRSSSSVRRQATTLKPLPPSSSSHGHHSHTSTHSTERRSLPPEAVYARRGFTGPESGHGHSFARGEMRTFHCERLRKMPLSGLDPMMLLGSVARDEAEWVDLRRKVKELPRTIFAIADEPPTWLGANDDEMNLKSISGPDEVEGEVGMDDGDMSSASHAPSSNASHGVSTSSHVAVSTFSHTHQHHNSNSTTHSASTSSSGSKGTVGDTYAEVEGDDGFVDAGGEVKIKDDWIDPIAPPPAPAPIAKKGSKGKGKSKGKKVVPVSSVHYLFPVSAEDGSGAGTPSSPRERERERGRERMITVSLRAAGVNATTGGQRMHTARARDGGWTEGRGVRGILTENS